MVETLIEAMGSVAERAAEEAVNELARRLEPFIARLSRIETLLEREHSFKAYR